MEKSRNAKVNLPDIRNEMEMEENSKSFSIFSDGIEKKKCKLNFIESINYATEPTICDGYRSFSCLLP